VVKLIKIPLPDMIAKIQEKTGLSQSQIEEKISAKMQALAGFISKEGAVHIIANELGVKLFESSGKIKDVYAGMKSVEVLGKVTNIFEAKEFKRQDGTAGKVGSFVIGDETGTIRVVGWGTQADIVKDISQGTIVRVQGGLAKESNLGYREIHCSEHSRIIINPSGETVGEVKSTSKPIAVRKEIKQLTEQDTNAELLGTIVQVFDPRFFEVCPECNARVKEVDGAWQCDVHKAVAPAHNIVLNAVLDDGTDNIRCVFFRQQAESLIGKTQEEIASFRTQPDLFGPVKTELLGVMVKLTGRAKKNDFFNRIEFVANNIMKNPNPQEELERLKTTTQ